MFRKENYLLKFLIQAMDLKQDISDLLIWETLQTEYFCSDFIIFYGN